MISYVLLPYRGSSLLAKILLLPGVSKRGGTAARRPSSFHSTDDRMGEICYRRRIVWFPSYWEAEARL